MHNVLTEAEAAAKARGGKKAAAFRITAGSRQVVQHTRSIYVSHNAKIEKKKTEGLRILQTGGAADPLFFMCLILTKKKKQKLSA